MNTKQMVTKAPEELLSFNDVLYRPISYWYRGAQHYMVHPTIVKNFCFRGDACYIVSYDVMGNRWEDPIQRLGKEVFKSKKTAENKLVEHSSKLVSVERSDSK